MAIYYDVEYQGGDHDPDCEDVTSSPTVDGHLVQLYSVMRPNAVGGEYVETVNVIYTPNAAGGGEGASFVLVLKDSAHAFTVAESEIRRVVTAGSSWDAAEIESVVSVSLGWEVTIKAPSTSASVSTAVFHFGAGAPATKLKVKVKKQGGFICGD